MLGSLFHNVLYVPIYNLLIAFADVVPNGDVGIAVILVTITVKLLISPLSLAAIKTQRRMKRIEPELRALREKLKDDRQAQALKMMELYKNNGIRPFASILVMLIQLPVIFALYFVFIREELLSVNLDLVYSFIPLPNYLSPFFLGIFETTGHSITLALLAGVFQYFQALVTIPVPPKVENPTGLSSEEFARAIAVQARYVLPIIIGVVAYASSAIALYLITASLFGIAQEYYVRIRYPELGKATDLAPKAE